MPQHSYELVGQPPTPSDASPAITFLRGTSMHRGDNRMGIPFNDQWRLPRWQGHYEYAGGALDEKRAHETTEFHMAEVRASREAPVADVQKTGRRSPPGRR